MNMAFSHSNCSLRKILYQCNGSFCFFFSFEDAIVLTFSNRFGIPYYYIKRVLQHKQQQKCNIQCKFKLVFLIYKGLGSSFIVIFILIVKLLNVKVMLPKFYAVGFLVGCIIGEQFFGSKQA